MNNDPKDQPPKIHFPGSGKDPFPRERAQGIPKDEDLEIVKDEKERDKDDGDE